jgi:hypothetical protein
MTLNALSLTTGRFLLRPRGFRGAFSHELRTVRQKISVVVLVADSGRVAATENVSDYVYSVADIDDAVTVGVSGTLDRQRFRTSTS